MAIFTVTSNAVENVDIFVDVDFKAGMALMRDDNGRVVKADNSLIFQKTLSQKIGKFLGFATSDHSSAANTIIVPDVIGSSYIDNSYNFIRTENNEVLTTKRALNDNLNESLNKPYNPSENMVISRRGLAVYNQPNNIFITDQFARVLHGDYGLDYTTQIDFNSGDLLTFGSGVNAGKLVKVNVNSIAQEILIVGVVEKFISSTNLLHFRQVFYSHPFSNDSAVMVLDAGNPYSFPNTGYIGTVCGITQNENQTMTLTAPTGHVFDKVLFASYGTPNGVCGSFSIGSCHAATSQSVVEGILLGNNSGTITQGGAFGDPCMGTNKRLYVQARFAPVQAKDLTVNNNNGTITNGASYSTDGGGSWAFDGTNDYITIPNSSTNNPSDNFTVQFWFLPKIAASKVLVFKYTGSVQGWLFAFNMNTITFDGRNLTADGYKQIASNTTVILNNWYHVVGVKAGTNMYLYQNGLLVGSTTWTTPGDMATNNPIYIQGYGGDFIQCNITDFRIYNRALSASEIIAYYNNTKSRYGL